MVYVCNNILFIRSKYKLLVHGYYFFVILVYFYRYIGGRYVLGAFFCVGVMLLVPHSLCGVEVVGSNFGVLDPSQ